MLHECYVSSRLKKHLGSDAGHNAPWYAHGTAFREIHTPIAIQMMFIKASIHFVPISLESANFILNSNDPKGAE